MMCFSAFFFQAEDGIRDLVRSRGLGDVYKRQNLNSVMIGTKQPAVLSAFYEKVFGKPPDMADSANLSLIHI